MKTNGATATAEPEREPTAEPETPLAPVPEPGSDRKGGPAPTKDDGPAFFDFCAELGDRWLNGEHKIWVYRIWPKIDRMQQSVYIGVIQEAIDEDYLLRTFGSGRYLMMLKHRNRLVRKHTVSVHNPQYPPVVNPAEVIDDPANQPYFAAFGKRREVPASSGGTAGRDSDTNEILRTVLGRAGAFDPALAELWKSTAAQRDELSKLLSERNTPPDLLSQLRALREAGLMGGGEKPLDLLALISAVKGLQQPAPDPLVLLKQVRDLVPPARDSEPPANALGQLRDLLAVFAQAKDVFTSPEAAPAHVAPEGAGPWESIASSLASNLAPTLQSVAAMIAAIKSAPGQLPAAAPGVTPAAPPAAAFDPYRRPDLLRQHAQQQAGAPAPQPNPPGATPAPAPGATPAAGPSQGPSAPAPAPVEEQQATDVLMTQQIAALVAQALNCLQRDVDGSSAAAAYQDLYGGLAFDALADGIKVLTIPGAIGVAKGVPELAGQIAAYESQLVRFINQFVAGPLDEDGEPSTVEAEGSRA